MFLSSSPVKRSQKPVPCAMCASLRPNGQSCWRSGQPCWQSTRRTRRKCVPVWPRKRTSDLRLCVHEHVPWLCFFCQRACEMSAASSVIVRSLENVPAWPSLRIAFHAQASGLPVQGTALGLGLDRGRQISQVREGIAMRQEHVDKRGADPRVGRAEGVDG